MHFLLIRPDLAHVYMYFVCDVYACSLNHLSTNLNRLLLRPRQSQAVERSPSKIQALSRVKIFLRIPLLQSHWLATDRNRLYSNRCRKSLKACLSSQNPLHLSPRRSLSFALRRQRSVLTQRTKIKGKHNNLLKPSFRSWTRKRLSKYFLVHRVKVRARTQS